MPKLRRRQVGISVGVSMGSLLADRDRDIRLADNAAAKAEAEANKRTNELSAKAGVLLEDYKSGTITYQELEEGLQAIKAQSQNGELIAKIDSAIRAGKATQLSREITAKGEEFTRGTVSYDQYIKYLNGVKTENSSIKEAISKNLVSARSFENTRVMNQSYQDYLNGKLSIQAYMGKLQELRDTAGQTAADLTTISTAIDNARLAETQLADQKTYADWQAGTIGAGEAMAYFQARIATSKNPTDQANAAKFLGNIKQSADASAKGSGSALSKLIDENAIKDMEAYKEQILKPGIVACDGDPACVMGLYDEYGNRAQKWAGQGGTLSTFWSQEFERAEMAGAIAAANSQYNKFTKDFTESMAKAEADKDANPAAKAKMIASAAKRLIDGEFSAFMTDDQKGDLNTKRMDAVRQIQQIAEAALAERSEAQAETTAGATRLYNDMKKGVTLFGSLPSVPFKLDGTPQDFDAFVKWLEQNPAVNATMAYDFGNQKKDSADSDAASKAAIEAFLSSSDTASQDATGILSALYSVQFPTLNADQLKAAAQKGNETGEMFASRIDVDNFLVNIGSGGIGGAQRGGDNWARDERSFLGGFRISTDQNGNTILSSLTHLGADIDLGKMGETVRPEAPGIAERERGLGGPGAPLPGETAFAQGVQPTQDIMPNTDLAQRKGEQGAMPLSPQSAISDQRAGERSAVAAPANEQLSAYSETAIQAPASLDIPTFELPDFGLGNQLVEGFSPAEFDLPSWNVPDLEPTSLPTPLEMGSTTGGNVQGIDTFLTE